MVCVVGLNREACTFLQEAIFTHDLQYMYSYIDVTLGQLGVICVCVSVCVSVSVCVCLCVCVCVCVCV